MGSSRGYSSDLQLIHLFIYTYRHGGTICLLGAAAQWDAAGKGRKWGRRGTGVTIFFLSCFPTRLLCGFPSCRTHTRSSTPCQDLLAPADGTAPGSWVPSPLLGLLGLGRGVAVCRVPESGSLLFPPFGSSRFQAVEPVL